MVTPLHLNTVVNGSVSMCGEAADRLNTNHGHAETATDQYYAGRSTAQSGWEGPASLAFQDSLEPLLQHVRDLAETCRVYSGAIGDFADRLEKVTQRMDDIREKARAGSLEVHGPFVLRPENPALPPEITSGPIMPGQNSTEIYMRLKAQEAYAAKVADYNGKVKVFNECLAIYKYARNLEKEAHQLLWELLGPSKGFDVDGWFIGNTAVSRVIGTVGSAENARIEALTKANQLDDQSKTFQLLASGKLPDGGYTAKQRVQLMQAAARAGVEEKQYREKIQQLDRLLKRSPEWLRTGSSAYPGKEVLDLKNITSESSLKARTAKKVFSKLPYAGSALVTFNEGLGAATGEQTWGKAVASTAGVLGGGAAGGTAGAVICAPVVPPWGSLVCGGAGSMLGGFAGGEVVDYYVPDEQADMPKPAEVIDYGAPNR